MKRVTITYTRENLNTPWYWETPTASGAFSFEEYQQQNRDKIEQFAYTTAQGYKFITILTFTDDQSYDDCKAMIATDIAPEYLEYCENNNITIENVTEDI
jgi:hypothetical protein